MGVERERLMRATLQGDHGAARVLSTLAKRSGEVGMASLARVLAEEEPSCEAWERLSEELDVSGQRWDVFFPSMALPEHHTSRGALEAFIAQLDEAFSSRWSGVVRRARVSWVEALLDRGQVVPWLRWCSHVEIASREVSRVHLERLASLSIAQLTQIAWVNCDWLGDTEVLTAKIAQLIEATSAVHLTFSNTSIEAGFLHSLLGCSQLERLETLELTGLELTLADCQILAEATHLVGLRELVLESCGLRSEAAVILAKAPFLKGVEVLELGGNEIDVVGCNALSASPYLCNELRRDAHGWERNRSHDELYDELYDDYGWEQDHLSIREMITLHRKEFEAGWGFSLQQIEAHPDWRVHAAYSNIQSQQLADVELRSLAEFTYYDSYDPEEALLLNHGAVCDPQLEDVLFRQALVQMMAHTDEDAWWIAMEDSSWFWQQLYAFNRDPEALDEDDRDEPWRQLHDAPEVWCERLHRARLWATGYFEKWEFQP